MDSLIKMIATVHESVHNRKMLKDYTTPKIYHGGKTYDLSKRWYVYYSYRNPKTGNLERQNNLSIRANRMYKTKHDRLQYLRSLCVTIEYLLANGYNPHDIKTKTIRRAEYELNFALNQKKHVISSSSFTDYENRLGHFKKFLAKKNMLQSAIEEIERKHVVEFLNGVLAKSGPRNRNNSRVVLSSIFSELEQNEIINHNFVKSIKPLKTNPTRNKTYTQKQVDEIFNWLEKNNPYMLLFLKFVSYGFLRPIEVCRLKVGDINFDEKTLTVKAKNKTLKTKTIPEILLSEIEFLKPHKKTDWIFTPDGVGSSVTSEINRRDYFSKQFLKVKNKLKLGKNYTMYSFRHTYTTKVYRELRKKYAPHQAKSELMLITGHSTMAALEKYLRDIDAELPHDYSALL